MYILCTSNNWNIWVMATNPEPAPKHNLKPMQLPYIFIGKYNVRTL